MNDGSDQASLEARVSADLVARIGGGDRSAEAAMIDRYGRGVLYLLRRRTRDPDLAQDIRQETFRIAIEKLRGAPLEEPERLAAYLRGVAVNLVSASWRKRARQATTPDSDAIERMPDESSGPFDDLSRERVGSAVRALLDELPVARDREVLIRLYLEDEDREVICAALGISSSHFNRVLFRAKQRFKTLLLGAEQRGKLKLVG